jgi:Carboxypeptidase regulatory-like domain
MVTVNSTREDTPCRSLDREFRSSVLRRSIPVWLSLSILVCGFSTPARGSESLIAPVIKSRSADVPRTARFSDQQAPDPDLAGNISGTVVDQTGTVVAGARVKLTREGQSETQETASDGSGQFSFANISPGPFQLTITEPGLATQTYSGTLNSGQAYAVPRITMPLAPVITEVRVQPSQTEIAEEQIKAQEKQRVLGVIPNFYVSYVPKAAPLTSKQKFQLAWKNTIDPVTFGVTGAIAGIEQWQNQFSGYGGGAQGYGKRYGASYADLVSGTFIGSAILPSLLKQDPRYFYKGTGTTKSRFLYAMANAVICKGDNGKWQPNYSNILGSLAAGGISNLYYPASDRNGVGLTFETALIGIGATAGVNVLQEFVIRKITPNLPNHNRQDPGGD